MAKDGDIIDVEISNFKKHRRNPKSLKRVGTI